MMCEATNDAEGLPDFRWFKVSDDDEDELTNVVGSVSVAGGELIVDASTINNGDVFRCKLDDQVGFKVNSNGATRKVLLLPSSLLQTYTNPT